MYSTKSNDSRLPSEQSTASSLVSSGPGTPPHQQLLLPPSYRSSRHRRRMVISLFLLPVLVLLLAGGLALTLGSGLAFFAPGATITLTPRSTLERQTIAIRAVVGISQQGQAQARFLTAITQTSRSTVPATGSGHLAAQAARGQVTFYNLATYSIAIPAGILLTGRDGVKIVTDRAAQVLAGNPPTMGHASVPSHAVHPGPSGNIAAGDINVLCCADGIVVKNQQAFSGGHDARSFVMVAQSDIDEASTQLVASLTQQGREGLLAQVRPGERTTPPACAPQVVSNPSAGQEATQVTVSVSVTCRGEAYNAQQVDALAAAFFQQQENAMLGPNYALDGQVTASEEQAGITESQPGNLAIPVAVRGLWVYRVNRSGFRALAKQVAGKGPAAARAILLRLPGVVAASIQLSGWNASTLPTDVNQIVIVVAPRPKP